MPLDGNLAARTPMNAKTCRLGWKERAGEQVRGMEVEMWEHSCHGSLHFDQLKVILILQLYPILTFFVSSM